MTDQWIPAAVATGRQRRRHRSQQYAATIASAVRPAKQRTVATATTTTTAAGKQVVVAAATTTPTHPTMKGINRLNDNVICHIMSYLDQYHICDRTMLSHRFHHLSHQPAVWHTLNLTIPPYSLAKWLNTFGTSSRSSPQSLRPPPLSSAVPSLSCLPSISATSMPSLGISYLNLSSWRGVHPIHLQLLTPHVCRSLTRLTVRTSLTMTIDDITTWLDTFAAHPVPLLSTSLATTAISSSTTDRTSSSLSSSFELRHVRIESFSASGWSSIISRYGHALQQFRLTCRGDDTVTTSAAQWQPQQIIKLLAANCPNLWRLRLRVNVIPNDADNDSDHDHDDKDNHGDKNKNDNPSSITSDHFGAGLLASIRALQLHGYWYDSRTLATLLASFKRLEVVRLPHCRGDDHITDHSIPLSLLIDHHRESLHSLDGLDIFITNEEKIPPAYLRLKELNLKRLDLVSYVPWQCIQHMNNLEKLFCGVSMPSSEPLLYLQQTMPLLREVNCRIIHDNSNLDRWMSPLPVWYGDVPPPLPLPLSIAVPATPSSSTGDGTLLPSSSSSSSLIWCSWFPLVTTSRYMQSLLSHHASIRRLCINWVPSSRHSYNYQYPTPSTHGGTTSTMSTPPAYDDGSSGSGQRTDRELAHDVLDRVTTAIRSLPHLRDLGLTCVMQREPQTDVDDDEATLVSRRLERLMITRKRLTTMGDSGGDDVPRATTKKTDRDKTVKQQYGSESKSSKHSSSKSYNKGKPNKATAAAASASTKSSNSNGSSSSLSKLANKITKLTLASDDPVGSCSKTVERSLLPTVNAFIWPCLEELKIDASPLATLAIMQPIISTAPLLRSLTINDPMDNGVNGLLRLLGRYCAGLIRVDIVISAACPYPDTVSMVACINGCRYLRSFAVVHTVPRLKHELESNALAVEWFTTKYVAATPPSNHQGCMFHAPHQMYAIAHTGAPPTADGGGDTKRDDDDGTVVTHTRVCGGCIDEREVHCMNAIAMVRARPPVAIDRPHDGYAAGVMWDRPETELILQQRLVDEYPLDDRVLDALHHCQSLVYLDISRAWFTTKAIVRLIQAVPSISAMYFNEIPSISNHTLHSINEARAAMRIPFTSSPAPTASMAASSSSMNGMSMSLLHVEITGTSCDIEVNRDTQCATHGRYPLLTFTQIEDDVTPYQAAVDYRAEMIDRKIAKRSDAKRTNDINNDDDDGGGDNEVKDNNNDDVDDDDDDDDEPTDDDDQEEATGEGDDEPKDDEE